MIVKSEYILLFVLIVFLFYHLMNNCGCYNGVNNRVNGFSVGGQSDTCHTTALECEHTKECEGVDLSNCNLDAFYLENVNLSGANLSGASLSNAYLHKANLSGANLNKAYLSRATLYESNLTNASLNNAILTDANLNNAILTGVIRNGSKQKIICNNKTIFFPKNQPTPEGEANHEKCTNNNTINF